MVSVDLGNRTSKAVYLQRRGSQIALCGYAVLDAPIFEKALSPEMLAEHLKALYQVLQPKTRCLTLTLGVNDAVVRPVDMPRLPLDDLRSVLKLNARAYLQQDYSGYIFDGYVMLSWSQPDTAKTGAAAAQQKQRVLVAGAKKQLVDDYVQGARDAGWTAEALVPSLVGPVNAFEQAMPEVFMSESVALVDIGFKNSSICILQKGELALSRIVGIGGDRLTQGVSEAMNISYAEAEGIKIGMPEEARPAMDASLVPLGRELRASIDYFEHQQDKMVSRVFVSGASAGSPVVMQTLQAELMVECKTWDPTRFLQMDLPPAQAAQMGEVGPQLAVAVGAALATF